MENGASTNDGDIFVAPAIRRQRPPGPSWRSATTGVSVGALAFRALRSALAIGALAIGRLAVGRFTARDARIDGSGSASSDRQIQWPKEVADHRLSDPGGGHGSRTIT
jgi:hypothetical protein